MLKCVEVDKLGDEFIQSMEPDTVYKLKDKALIAYIDVNRLAKIQYALSENRICRDKFERWCGNIFDCFRSAYGCGMYVYTGADFPSIDDIAEDKRTLEQMFKHCKKQIRKVFPLRTEVGVELELEPESREDFCYDSEDSDSLKARFHDIDETELIEAIKSDCSVYGETELNLKHMSLNKWRKSGIKELLTKLREVTGLDNRYGTAGMHVHVSGPGVTEVARAVSTSRENLGNFLDLIGFRREKIETPGCGRNASFTRYGTKTDAIRDQLGCHGTIEFRCFEVTTDYDLFMLRIRFVTELFKYLAEGNKIEDFATKGSKKARAMFMRLYKDSRNPHAYGVLKDEELKLMEA